ncbi:hypothetical protein [Frankia sp. Cj5]|uniref:hypothetical protein n=1 Tax=Frankia sp. Cj5 TaxID=2880978 RepID=UPI001EF6EDE4|nr:hypothetical protein [Frankia sp. Cj5]
MRVVLLESVIQDGDRVLFTAEGGRGIASWRGDGAQVAGVAVDVEVEVHEEIDWSEIVVDPQPGTIVDVLDQAMVFRGVVEDLDKDGVLTLRFGSGIVLVDTTGEAPLGVVGRDVSLTVRDIEIYPTGV